jgi:hypothetical protein
VTYCHAPTEQAHSFRLDQVSRMKIRKSRTRVNKLFGAPAYSQATDVNYEGAPSFVRNDEEALTPFAHVASSDPHFLAQAILYARTEGLQLVGSEATPQQGRSECRKKRQIQWRWQPNERPSNAAQVAIAAPCSAAAGQYIMCSSRYHLNSRRLFEGSTRKKV